MYFSLNTKEQSGAYQLQLNINNTGDKPIYLRSIYKSDDIVNLRTAIAGVIYTLVYNATTDAWFASNLHPQITENDISSGAVTSDKVDWTTIGKSSNHYIKFGDIVIQWGVADFGNQSFSTDFWTTFNRAANLGMYFNYPIAFDEKPVLMMNLVDVAGTLLGICYTAQNGSGSRSPNFTVYSPKGFTSTVNVKVQWVAIGVKA